MNSTQQLFIDWIRPAEGGLVDDPDDPGRITKFGISLRFLQSLGELGDIDGDGDVDADDVRALTHQISDQLIIDHFWMPCRCDDMPPAVAFCVGDMAVNGGAPRAARILQTTLVTHKIKVAVDGKIGPQTLAAINRFGDELPALYQSGRAQYYHSITLAKSKLAKFLPGWFNRLFLLDKHICEVLQ